MRDPNLPDDVTGREPHISNPDAPVRDYDAEFWDEVDEGYDILRDQEWDQ